MFRSPGKRGPTRFSPGTLSAPPPRPPAISALSIRGESRLPLSILFCRSLRAYTHPTVSELICSHVHFLAGVWAFWTQRLAPTYFISSIPGTCLVHTKPNEISAVNQCTDHHNQTAFVWMQSSTGTQHDWLPTRWKYATEGLCWV